MPFIRYPITATLTRQRRAATKPSALLIKQKGTLSTPLSLQNILKNAFTEEPMMYASQ